MITNTIIVIAVVLLVGLAVYIQIRKAKKGSSSCGCDGGCCSTKNSPEDSSFSSNAKKLVLSIDGMHCGHCQKSVSEALNSLDGVSATVDLENNCANVELSKDVPEADLIEAVSAKGFEVTAVKAV